MSFQKEYFQVLCLRTLKNAKSECPRGMMLNVLESYTWARTVEDGLEKLSGPMWCFIKYGKFSRKSDGFSGPIIARNHSVMVVFYAIISWKDVIQQHSVEQSLQLLVNKQTVILMKPE